MCRWSAPGQGGADRRTPPQESRSTREQGRRHDGSGRIPYRREGLVERPAFRLPGSPVTEIVTIVFLLSVLVLMWQDPEIGRRTLFLIPVIGVALAGGWFAVRKKVARHQLDQSYEELGIK